MRQCPWSCSPQVAGTSAVKRVVAAHCRCIAAKDTVAVTRCRAAEVAEFWMRTAVSAPFELEIALAVVVLQRVIGVMVGIGGTHSSAAAAAADCSGYSPRDIESKGFARFGSAVVALP